MNLNVPDLVAPMLATHRSGKNLSLKWRLTQLNALLLMITECEEDIADALYEDLHKEKTEALSTEILVVKNEIIRFQKELKGWMVPEQVPTPAVCAPSFCEIKRVPLSEPACLIIGPFNFPFSLPFLAAVGAFGGKNTKSQISTIVDGLNIIIFDSLDYLQSYITCTLYDHYRT